MVPTDLNGHTGLTPSLAGTDQAAAAMLAFTAMDMKKARELVLLEVGAITPLADYFLIGTTNTAIQARAVADAVIEKLAESGVHPTHTEGYELGHWILIDYGFLVVHVFTPEEREFYSLERLWGQAPVVRQGEDYRG